MVKIFKSDDARFRWPKGNRSAISLSFDDARLSKVDNGLPLFAKYDVKATFYVLPSYVEERLEGWKKAVASGHEIGNHTLTHPCTGNYAFSRQNALENYTLEMMAYEMDSADEAIKRLLGLKPKSFAYPCGQKFVGRRKETQSYVPLVVERFLSGRGWLDEDSNDPGFCDLIQVLAMECDGKTFEELKEHIEKTVEESRWLVLAGHEIANSGRQTTFIKTLEALCQYVQEPTNCIWMDTVGTISQYIQRNR